MGHMILECLPIRLHIVMHIDYSCSAVHQLLLQQQQATNTFLHAQEHGCKNLDLKEDVSEVFVGILRGVQHKSTPA